MICCIWICQFCSYEGRQRGNTKGLLLSKGCRGVLDWLLCESERRNISRGQQKSGAKRSLQDTIRTTVRNAGRKYRTEIPRTQFSDASKMIPVVEALIKTYKVCNMRHLTNEVNSLSFN